MQCNTLHVKRSGKAELQSGWTLETRPGWCVALDASNAVVVLLQLLDSDLTKTVYLHELLDNNPGARFTIVLDEFMWPAPAAIWREALGLLPISVVDNTCLLKRDAPAQPSRKVMTKLACDACGKSMAGPGVTDSGGGTFTSPFDYLFASWLCGSCNVDPTASRASVRMSVGLGN